MLSKIYKIILILVAMLVIDSISYQTPSPKATFEITKQLPPITETKIYATVDYPGRAEKASEIYLAKKKAEQEALEELEKQKITNRSSVERTEWKEFVATGYCSCSRCCGVSSGITASGVKAQANHTIAMPKKYKFGTKIEIKDLGTYVVEDRGGAIKGNKLDIYFASHQEALNWGRKTILIKVIE